jgi:protein TonB
MEVKKNPNVDPKRNSTLYFQIGLAAVLLLTYVGIELKSEDPRAEKVELVIEDNFVEDDVAILTMPPAQKLPPPPPPAPVEIQVVDNKVEIKETKIEKTETNENTQQQETKTADSYGDEGSSGEDIPDELPFSVIEQVPMFPGCENVAKDKQMDCFQEQMQKHIKKNFSYPERAMEDGVQGRVQVEYIIGTDGKVVIQRVKGPKGGELLEKEAKRIIEKLPTLKPGMQRKKPVKVRHVVPITFKLQ